MNPKNHPARACPRTVRTLIAAICLHSLFTLHTSPLLHSATIDLTNTIIVNPTGTSVKVVDYAAQELQTHLQLITGSTAIIPIATDTQTGKFPIYVGVTPPAAVGISGTLTPEEARWAITGTAIWLYGHDKDVKGTDTQTVALDSDARTGSLFAVYEFLEKYAGIIWTEPGAAGVIYTPKTTLAPTIETGSWTTEYYQRKIRLGYSADFRNKTLLAKGNIPTEMKFSDDEFAQRQLEEQVWMRRMRMGSNLHLSYGHAFTDWWEKYGANGTVSKHPEYFAMLESGKRQPASADKPDRIKLCVSNPDVAKFVAYQHFFKPATGALNAIKDIGYYVNAVENDSGNYCNCENCKALDVLLPGEDDLRVDDRILTDRYVYFANKVLEEARKLYIANYASDYGADSNPGARIRVHFYAYSRYNFPPRREHIDPGVFLFLLPNLGTPLTEIDQYFVDWKAKDADEFIHRPNDLNQDTGHPIGFEYHMFEKNRIGASRLTHKGTDYDMCWDFWPVSGITYYIMARAMYRPDKPFAYWETEYLNTYGGAAADLREYHTYWRQIWNQRIMNNREKIDAIIKAKDISILRDKVTHLTDQLYSENDYDLTDAMLAKALTRAGLTAQQRARIQNLQLANQHARLKYHAVRDNCLASPTTDNTQKKASTRALLDFRKDHRLDLNIHWEALIYLENVYCDNAGTKRLLGTEDTDSKNFRLTSDATITANRLLTNLSTRPALTTITPADITTGDTITINGTNLYDIDNVKIGGITATTWTRVDANTITATVPAGVPATGSVTVNTRGDSATSPTKYYVIHPVTTVRQLADQTVVTGLNLTLTASSDGHPLPAYTWQTSADGANWTTITNTGKYTISADTSVLKITGVDDTLAGHKYRYTAANPQTATPIISTAANLTIQPDTRYPHPVALAVDTAKNIYVADNALRTVQRIAASNNYLTTYAGAPGVSGTTNATGADARFTAPVALAIAPGSQLIIADNEANNLRIATSAAVITTLATGLNPAAIATDTSGNTYIADATGNCIRMVTLSGVMTTIAGSGTAGSTDATGSAARFNAPAGVAISASGTIYVADTGNHTIRAISPGSRTVTTIAGLPTDDSYADGNALTEAAFNSPRALAIKDNALYIADTGNSLIRKLDLTTGTVTTIAGRPGPAPTHGYQNATGTDAIFDHPQGLALDTSGNLYVADTGNAALRKIAPNGAVTTLLPAITTTSTTGTTGNSGNNTGGSGGGGAPTLWYFAALATIALTRLAPRRK